MALQELADIVGLGLMVAPYNLQFPAKPLEGLFFKISVFIVLQGLADIIGCVG